MSMGKIMVADDDSNICELLRLYLEKEGFTVTLAHDGEAAVEQFFADTPDLVLLDIMMPKLDGWQVCREIRKKSNTPIIMLTAKGETFDKVLGLELGAAGKVVDTPPKELELLFHLASNPNRVYTRDQLLDEVWGFEYYGDSRTVDVHIKRLREKLEGVSDQWSLKTVWGVGYKFELKE